MLTFKLWMAKRGKIGTSWITVFRSVMGWLEESGSIKTSFRATNRPLCWFTRMAAPQAQLNSVALVDRFSRRSIVNGGQCAYYVVEESTASAHDVSIANKQATSFEDVKGNIHTP
jgi:hypothetical protein